MEQEILFPPSLRSLQGEFLYQRAKSKKKTKPLNEVPAISEWKYWRLINNDFPYDAVYKTCHMLVTKEEAPDWDDLSEEARDEYFRIRTDYLLDTYDQIIENCPSTRSVKGIYHKHLVDFYDNRSDMGFERV